ncbi:MAG: hypothetical protein KDB80_00020 [Planctomycetes bacterium]|nr:hypothetical protein [Planctomycetota bacterium]
MIAFSYFVWTRRWMRVAFARLVARSWRMRSREALVDFVSTAPPTARRTASPDLRIVGLALYRLVRGVALGVVIVSVDRRIVEAREGAGVVTRVRLGVGVVVR